MFHLAEKASGNYFNQKKKQQLLFSILSFLMVIIIYATGWILYDTNKSIYTVIAAVAVIPFARIFVSYLMVMPYHSPEAEKIEKLQAMQEKYPQSRVLYDILLASEKNAVLAGTIFVLNGNIAVYAEHKRMDSKKTEEQLKKILEGCGYSSLKVYTDFEQYNKKLKELMTAWDKKEWSAQELERIKLQTERICKKILIYAI